MTTPLSERQQTKQPSRFLALPVELRKEIYGYYFEHAEGTRTRLRHSGVYLHAKDKEEHSLALANVCSQLRKEVMDHYFEMARLSISRQSDEVFEEELLGRWSKHPTFFPSIARVKHVEFYFFFDTPGSYSRKRRFDIVVFRGRLQISDLRRFGRSMCTCEIERKCRKIDANKDDMYMGSKILTLVKWLEEAFVAKLATSCDDSKGPCTECGKACWEKDELKIGLADLGLEVAGANDLVAHP